MRDFVVATFVIGGAFLMGVLVGVWIEAEIAIRDELRRNETSEPLPGVRFVRKPPYDWREDDADE